MRTRFLTITPLLIMVSIGCNQPTPPQRVAVSGRVSLDGKPLDQGTIRFVSSQRNGDATTTIQQGHFQFDQDAGPLAGPYDVIIRPLSPELPAAMASMQAGDRDPLHVRQVPLKYQTTGLLKTTIEPEQVDELHFELTSR